MVQVVETLEEFNEFLNIHKEKLIIVDFTATWCGPCKAIAPLIDELAKVNEDIIFLKVDVDDAEEISSKVGIKCMPTFIFYKNGVQVHEFSGANPDMLKEGIAKHR